MTTAPPNPVDHLVQDMGYRPGDIAEQHLVGNPELTDPHSFSTSDVHNGKTLVWGVNGTNGLDLRYGTYKSGSSINTRVPPRIIEFQATNFVKKVKILGLYKD